MSAFWRFFRAERVKWWRSWGLLTAVLTPITQVGTLMVIMWFSGDKAIWLGTGFASWYKINYIAWNLVLMPISVAMVAALSWDLEDSSRAWNRLLIMPAPRFIHFVVKFASHLSLMFLSQLLLALLLIISGLILKAKVPTLPMGSFSPSLLFHFAAYSVAASIPVVSLHTWVPARFPNLGSSLGMALIGSWFTFQYSGMTSFICILPWGLASQVTNIALRAILPSPGMYLSSACSALACLLLGLLDFNRRAWVLNR
jgi:hypothetical protein